MAKIEAYLLSFFLFGSLLPLQAGLMHTISRFPFAYAGAMALHCGIAHQTALHRIGHLAWYKINRKKAKVISEVLYLDAAPEVTQFVLQRMQKHGINHQGIQVKQKVVSIGHTFSCDTNTIFIRRDIHEKFVQVLTQKNLTPQEQERLHRYTITIDHEIAHIKNKDYFRSNIMVPAVSVGLQGLALVIAKKLKRAHYFKPSHYRPDGVKDAAFDGYLILAAAGMGLHLAHRAVTNYLFRRQEAAADAFALQKIERPEAFDAYIKDNNQMHQESVAICADMAAALIDPTRQSLAMSEAPHLAQLYFDIYVAVQYRYYKNSVVAAEQSVEHFKQWLIARPSFAHVMGQVLPAKHPSFIQRIEQARYYAAEFAKKPNGLLA